MGKHLCAEQMYGNVQCYALYGAVCCISVRVFVFHPHFSWTEILHKVREVAGNGPVKEEQIL